MGRTTFPLLLALLLPFTLHAAGQQFQPKTIQFKGDSEYSLEEANGCGGPEEGRRPDVRGDERSFQAPDGFRRVRQSYLQVRRAGSRLFAETVSPALSHPAGEPAHRAGRGTGCEAAQPAAAISRQGSGRRHAARRGAQGTGRNAGCPGDHDHLDRGALQRSQDP